jgi:hypothetical protein
MRKAIARVLLVSAAAPLILAAGSGIGQVAAKDAVHRLSEAELQQQLVGGGLRPDPAVVATDTGFERFMATGEYARYGDRSRRYGRYEIQGNLVCTQFGQGMDRSCFSLERDREGRTWKVDQDGKYRAAVILSSAAD